MVDWVGGFFPKTQHGPWLQEVVQQANAAVVAVPAYLHIKEAGLLPCRLQELSQALDGVVAQLSTHISTGLSNDALLWLQELAQAADAVVAAVDEGKLAKHLARKTPVEGPAATKDAKQQDEVKAALIEALRWKCEALLQSSPDQGRAEAGAAGAAEAEEVPQEQEVRQQQQRCFIQLAVAALLFGALLHFSWIKAGQALILLGHLRLKEVSKKQQVGQQQE